EGAIVRDGRAFDIAFPALGADPASQAVIPVRAVRVNPASHLKIAEIELKHLQVAELITVGIEELIVVNVGMLPEDPFAIGIQISLWRLALDFIAQGVLPLVGVGKVDLVEEKQSSGQQRAHDKNRHDDSVN